MKSSIKIILVPLALIVLLFIAAVPGYAQGSGPVTIDIDRTSLTTDDFLTLTITVSADLMNAPQPALPDLLGFNLLGSNSSSQISIINGAMSTQTVYQYQLQPVETGSLTIAPISIILNGQTYTTEPIVVEVTPGTGRPSMPNGPQVGSPLGSLLPPGLSGLLNQEPLGQNSFGGDSFVEAEVGNPNPYLGEQVVYTFRYHESGLGMLDQPHYQPPQFTGFWAEKEGDPQQYQVQANGQIYNVTELRTVLFPTKMGTLTIEPAHLATPGGFFGQGGELQSEPITLEVKPLPGNAPASFNGVVGQFDLTAAVDKTETKVNEPITWQITLSGAGNLPTAPDPVWSELDGWHSYDSQAPETNTHFQDGRLVGARVYERLILPQQAGEFTIPAVEYSYFDPQAGEYRTLTTEPIQVSVAPNGAAAVTPSYTPAPATHETPAEPQPSDIRYLKPIPARLSLSGGPHTGSPLYWLAWSVPLLGLMANFAWKRREQFWQNNPTLARSSQARRKAMQTLALAQRETGNGYNAAGQILSNYLGDKLDQPVAGFTQSALTRLLAERGLKASLIERVESCLAEAESGRYAPDAGSSTQAETLLQQVDRLIGDLEKVL
jgi:hypothetical protein